MEGPKVEEHYYLSNASHMWGGQRLQPAHELAEQEEQPLPLAVRSVPPLPLLNTANVERRRWPLSLWHFGHSAGASALRKGRRQSNLV